MGALTTASTLLAMNPATAPLGFAGIALGGLLSGVSGQSTANKVAGLQSQSATIQNQIFQEQFNIEKANMLQKRRSVFRQGQVRSAEAKVAAASTGQYRSSTYGAVQGKIAERTSENIANIDTAISTGERISTLNQQQADIQTQIASTQAQGSFLSAFF